MAGMRISQPSRPKRFSEENLRARKFSNLIKELEVLSMVNLKAEFDAYADLQTVLALLNFPLAVEPVMSKDLRI